MRRRLVRCALVAASLGALGSTGGLGAPSASAEGVGQSLAFNAASVDCHCYPSAHTVALYGGAISALRPRCTESARRYVAEAWATHNDLASHGKRLSTLGVLVYTRKSIPSSLGRTNCAQIMAALAVLMESG